MTTTDADEYLAVLKASYDYEPQSDEEVPISEGQLLFLLERTDEDWWRVKIKPDSQDEDSPSGLVPSAYVEPADHHRTVKALYNYESRSPGELSVAENDILLVYASEEAWILVASEEQGKAGFVPENYVEDAEKEEEEEESVTAPPQIVVPDSPPRLNGAYVDPADRVATAKASSLVNPADAIQTWAVHEVDQKGKKKKGALVIGSGSFYFASESDKAAVQKWATSSVTNLTIEKSKHIHISTTSAGTGTDLHFNAGSSSTAQAIHAKLESSRAMALESAKSLMTRPTPPPDEMRASPASALRMANGGPPKNANVRFAPAGPMFIPPSPEPSDDGAEEVEEHQETAEEEEPIGSSDAAVALYDFAADGEDELSMTEGETLLVLERDGDEWWKVRNMDGQEGVVPASYVEPVVSQKIAQATSTAKIPSVAATQPAASVKQATSATLSAAAALRAKTAAAKKAAREAEDREEAERLQAEEEAEELSRAEEEAREVEQAAERRRAERAEKTAKEKEAKSKREEKDKRDRERAKAAAAAEDARKAEEKGKEQRAAERERQHSSKSQDETPRPPRTDSSRSSGKSRIWHDRSGQFRVEAVFLGMNGDKLRLHKSNGVVIEVPSVKMSDEDMRYIEKLTRKKTRREGDDDDDISLAERRSSKAVLASSSASSTPKHQKRGQRIDWFEFFLSAGCDIDDCTRYASAFERDKMDASILPDITDATMRSLGLREGDIIRVGKAIAQRAPKKVDANAPPQAPAAPPTATSPPPNLFSAGPGGQLKAPRRGRPQPTKSASQGVDLATISSASDQIARTSSPAVATPSAASSLIELERPPRSSSALTSASGFDDDAWTNRPSSTKPITRSPAILTARAASAPPKADVLIDPPVAPPLPTISQSTAATGATTTSKPSLAATTESDIFDQLARLSAMKPTPPLPTSPVAISSPASTGTPAGYRQGMGMGPSPVPIGQLSAQPTGAPPPQTGPRGPYAPVASNQSLLQPLVPTTTGFNGFVPLRPSVTGAFPSYQPSTQSQSFSPQPLNNLPFLSSQQTGFAPTFLQSQPTGYSNVIPLLSHNTGFVPQSQGPFGSGSIIGQPTAGQSGMITNVGPYSNSGSTFGPIQAGYNGFNAPAMPSQTPPVPSLPQGISPANVFAQMRPPPPPLTSNNTSPANIFAQMKSGTFANESAPQPTEKYDALRVQPTGWGYQGY